VTARPRLAVSACLLGEPVRYDAGHKRSRYVTDVLGAHFELVPVCPELGIGMGVPRPPIHLVRTAAGLRARDVHDPQRDVTDALAGFGRRTAAQLADVSGYVLKSRSPSCGLARVRIRDEAGNPSGYGRGVHAQAVTEALPALPMEEEGRLAHGPLREAFLDRVYAYARWQAQCTPGATARALVAFHTAHKYLLHAHNQAAARRLGALVADAGRADPRAIGRAYLEGCMEALARPATRRSHANVLMHLAGYLKRALDAGDRAELAACIADYRTGAVARDAPLALLRHHFRRHPHPWAGEQVYLRGLPPELVNAPAP
jgi:uncharacterized protein YbgA (DUF1722 family)/uncharacterized protein YbbK (DUF523 family)